MEEYTNYLVHHGVKGQKWGVRRYQNEDGSLKSAGKNRPAKMKAGVAGRINLINAWYRSKTPTRLRKTALRTDQYSSEYASKYHANKAARAKTTLGKMYSTQKSRNYAANAKTYATMRQRDLGERAMSKWVFSSARWNQPYHRLSGRTTTLGRNLVNNMLGGIPGAAMDAAYLYNTNPTVRKKVNTAGKNIKNDFKRGVGA